MGRQRGADDVWTRVRCIAPRTARQWPTASCPSSTDPACEYLRVSLRPHRGDQATTRRLKSLPSAGTTTSNPLCTNPRAAFGAHIKPETSTTATLHSSPSSSRLSSSPSRSLTLRSSSSILATSRPGDSSSILFRTALTPPSPDACPITGAFPEATCLTPFGRCTSCEMGSWRT